MENKVVIDKELDLLKKDFLNYIQQFKKSIEDKQYYLVSNSSMNNLGWIDAFRFFIDEIQSHSSPIKDLVISSAYKINKSCPLALPLYFHVLTGGNVEIPERSIRVKSSDLIQQFKNVPDDFIKENLDVLLHCMYLAGASGTISVASTRDDMSVELESGYRTLCKIDKFFQPYFESQEIEDCKILVYNGAILEISEIHHILQSAYETRQKVVIVCSNVSEDVSNTLLVNWQQNKTFVIPFLIEDSTETLNEFRDIATISGADLISKESGLRLSSIDLEDLDSHSFYFNSLRGILRLGTDNKAQKRCARLRKQILEKIKKESTRDIEDILRSRFSRMSGRNVELKLRYDKSEEGLIQDKAAAFFRYFSECGRQGVARVETDYGMQYLPFIEVSRAVRIAEHDLACINKIKAVVRIEE